MGQSKGYVDVPLTPAQRKAAQAQKPYEDVPLPAPASPYGVLDAAKDVGVGAVKGVGNTVFGLGKMVRDYTPVGYISDAILPGAFNERPAEITPSNKMQQLGFTAEQMGEFFLPTGATSTVGKAVTELARTGVQTLAQTGDPTAAGVGMALTAVVPGAGVFRRQGVKLAENAEKTMAQALGATKEAHKVTAAKIAPEMLERGVGGSREAMLDRARSEVAGLKAPMRAAENAAVAAGQTIPSAIVRGELQLAKDALMVRTANGQLAVVPGSEAVVNRLERMDQFIESLGDDIPFDKALQVRRLWDKIVAKGGLYGPKAMATATDNAEAWATREGASSLRRLLDAASPDLAALNKEYAFWKGMKDVLKATSMRTQSQGGGLVSGIAGATGAASGFASGDSLGDSFEKALIGGVAGRQLIKLMQSPTWRTRVSAPLKFKLSQALTSGKVETIQQTARHIIESIPAQLRPALEPQ